MTRLLPLAFLLLVGLLLPAAAGAEGVAWVKVIPCPGTFDKFLMPRWSPDGKTVLVTSSGGSDLFVIDPATRTSRPLGTGRGTGLAAAWAGNGRWVLYCKEDRRTGERTVMSIEVATGKSRTLFSTRKTLSRPSRAFDGTVSVFDGGVERRWCPQTGAEEVTEGVTVPFLRVFDSCTSPEGDWVAFTCDDGFFLMGRQETAPRKVAYRGDEGWPSDPQFSPDGVSLVFVAPRERKDLLFILPVPDGMPNDRGPGASPRWTTAGKLVYCLSDLDPGTRKAKKAELHLIDPCAGPRKRFTPLTETGNRMEGALDLSPDGSMLACEDRGSGDLLIGRLPDTR